MTEHGHKLCTVATLSMPWGPSRSSTSGPLASPRLLSWIFSIGELHRWHHSAERHEADLNYGDTFIFWDAVFGTRFLPRGVEAPSDVGIRGLEALH